MMARRQIGHYEIVRKLGAGGSGVVYLASDTLLQRPVVLKLLRRGSLTLEQMRSTVLREARMASAIEHPNVCAIYDVGETEDEAYIVMQYVPGQSLDKLIAAGPASLQLLLSAGIQIADGMAAAHRLGIFHRDLKPANVMLTEGGLVKILDFGLARRRNPDDVVFDPSETRSRKGVARPDEGESPADAGRQPTSTQRGGTIAYMAPEQFVTGHSSAQSDIFALGVMLYELASGRHPFHRPNSEEMQSIRAIQFADPPSLRNSFDYIPAELESVIFRCLEKVPAQRYATAAEVREALRTVMQTLHLDAGLMPSSASADMSTTHFRPEEEEKRATGLLSMLAERFRESSGGANRMNSIVVLPFANFGEVPESGASSPTSSPMYGYALADAIAARLARVPSLVVRPSSALMALPMQQIDPLAVGEKLMVQYVLTGNFLRSEKGFDLNWQLLDVPGQSVRSGGAISVPSFDLVAVQTEICNEVFSSLQGVGHLQAHVDRTLNDGAPPLPMTEEVSEEYLQARALLSHFMYRTGSRDDLDRALELFEGVVARDNNFAQAWSGLGITHLQYVRHGLGGQMHLLASRRAFDKALDLDRESVEANLYRVYLLLSRGEKESVRYGIEHLLQTAGNDWNVRQVAGQTLRLDGMYEAALEQFGVALRLNPANAAIIYNHRARVYQYQNQMELAAEEIEKGLTLEPRQPLLLISRGYQQMRTGHLEQAIATMESVTQQDATLRIILPTLAICYLQLGDHKKASSMILEETLAAAEADSEMAYRLATYFATEGDESEALHWLRRAIYLGNENFPWFSINPLWTKMRGRPDFERIMDGLKKSFRSNQKNWKRVLAQF
jgi:serine/threonine-protein kinase